MKLRNHEKEIKEEIYLNNKIISWRCMWEEYNIKKDIWENKKGKIVCEIFRKNKHFINLGQCNDGSKFTAINQAINQAKEYINIVNKFNW